MKNMMNLTGSKMARITELFPNDFSSEAEAEYGFRESIRRFIQVGSLLTKEELVGWEVRFHNQGPCLNYAFASRGSKVEDEDLRWIFQPSMKAKEENSSLKSLFDGFRKVYALTFAPSENSNEDEGKEDGEKAEVSVEYDSLKLLFENDDRDIIFRFLLEGGKSSRMAVLISLNKEMSLRMRAALSFFFPETELVKIEKMDEVNESLLYLPSSKVIESMEALLRKGGYYRGREAEGEIGAWMDNLNTGDSGLLSPSEKIDELIGLYEVKRQLKQIVAYSLMKRDMKYYNRNMKPVILNMVFSGNPGTAKTTVARMLAEFFYDIGLISSPEIVEVGRSQLIGEYTGQTAPKVAAVFEKAKGKLLFIDEAYSLLDGYKGSFGDEAIDTIVQEMENRRGDTIVIFAGYPDKMEEFLDRNPGLKSRVPFYISFPDYSPEEMLEIVEMDASQRGFRITEDAKQTILSLCRKSAQSEEKGNGRFCRNLVDRALMSYAERVYGNLDDGEYIEHYFTLDSTDFRAYQQMEEDGKRRVIGFL